MNKKLKQLFFKITASILAFIFLIADVSWASPPTQNSQDYNLAVPSRCQQQPINAETARFQQSLFSEGEVLGSVFSIAKYLFEDNLPIGYMDQVLSAELGKAVEKIDLSRVIVKDGVILVPCEIKGKKIIIQIAPKDSPAAKNLVGYEWPIYDKYVIKGAEKKDTELS